MLVEGGVRIGGGDKGKKEINKKKKKVQTAGICICLTISFLQS